MPKRERGLAAVWATILAGGLCLATASPADAQILRSSSENLTTPREPPNAEVARTDRIFRDLIACVVRYQEARARNLLDTVPGTRDEYRLVSSFDSRSQQCYDGYRNGGTGMGWHWTVFRGVVAETFYRREYPSGLRPAEGISEERLNSWTMPRPTDGEVTEREFLHAMGRCAVVRKPREVHALVVTEPQSPDEARALAALQDELSACLTAGVELNATRQSLRGLLAEAALHYAESAGNGYTHVGRHTERGGRAAGRD